VSTAISIRELALDPTRLTIVDKSTDLNDKVVHGAGMELQRKT
jgi:hypothetical protein